MTKFIIVFLLFGCSIPSKYDDKCERMVISQIDDHLFEITLKNCGDSTIYVPQEWTMGYEGDSNVDLFLLLEGKDDGVYSKFAVPQADYNYLQEDSERTALSLNETKKYKVYTKYMYDMSGCGECRIKMVARIGHEEMYSNWLVVK